MSQDCVLFSAKFVRGFLAIFSACQPMKLRKACVQNLGRDRQPCSVQIRKFSNSGDPSCGRQNKQRVSLFEMSKPFSCSASPFAQLCCHCWFFGPCGLCVFARLFVIHVVRPISFCTEQSQTSNTEGIEMRGHTAVSSA